MTNKEKAIVIGLIILPWGIPLAFAYLYKKGYSKKEILDLVKSLWDSVFNRGEKDGKDS